MQFGLNQNNKTDTKSTSISVSNKLVSYKYDINSILERQLDNTELNKKYIFMINYFPLSGIATSSIPGRNADADTTL